MTMHPLVQRLLDQPGARALQPETLDDWLGRGREQVILFGGDPVRFPEALDVAVVLPELNAAFAGRLEIGVLAREHEDALARRFGVQRWPSLVFLRAGGYLGVVSGMRDWGDYLHEMGEVLAREPSRPPTVGIPVVAADGATVACH
jgi:hydrogenase-1 operon protein HyaE